MRLHIFHRWEYSEDRGSGAYRAKWCLRCPRRERYYPSPEAGWSEDRTDQPVAIEPAPVAKPAAKPSRGNYYARSAAYRFGNVEAASNMGKPMTVREFLLACAEDGPREPSGIPSNYYRSELAEAQASLNHELARTDDEWRALAEAKRQEAIAYANERDQMVARLQNLLGAIEGFQHEQKPAIEAAIKSVIKEWGEVADEQRRRRFEWKDLKAKAIQAARQSVDYQRREYEAAASASQERTDWHGRFVAAVDALESRS